jgi:amino acid transporter
MPAAYYTNCVFAWVTVLVAVVGYFYTLHRRGEKWAFWLIFATGFAMFGISHAMKLAGVDPGATSHTVIRIIAYSLVLIAVISLILKVRQTLR